jgi:hypothetical protein
MAELNLDPDFEKKDSWWRGEDDIDTLHRRIGSRTDRDLCDKFIEKSLAPLREQINSHVGEVVSVLNRGIGEGYFDFGIITAETELTHQNPYLINLEKANVLSLRYLGKANRLKDDLVISPSHNPTQFYKYRGLGGTSVLLRDKPHRASYHYEPRMVFGIGNEESAKLLREHLLPWELFAVTDALKVSDKIPLTEKERMQMIIDQRRLYDQIKLLERDSDEFEENAEQMRKLLEENGGEIFGYSGGVITCENEIAHAFRTVERREEIGEKLGRAYKLAHTRGYWGNAGFSYDFKPAPGVVESINFRDYFRNKLQERGYLPKD